MTSHAPSSAHAYPLTIRELLLTGVRRAPDQQIVYADKRRLTYREFEERIGRLGSALADLGVRHGHTVALMDWDSHRYLECFFAVPMIGAVLHTVNIRLSSYEQILYTMNQTPRMTWLLVHDDFLSSDRADLGQDQLTTVNRLHPAQSDVDAQPTDLSAGCLGEYENLLEQSDACGDFDFPGFQ